MSCTHFIRAMSCVPLKGFDKRSIGCRCRGVGFRLLDAPTHNHNTKYYLSRDSMACETSFRGGVGGGVNTSVKALVPELQSS